MSGVMTGAMTGAVTGGATCGLLPDGRLHLQHGPIDLVIGIDGTPRAVALARRAAWERFRGLLGELVAELALLRMPLRDEPPALRGPVACRMASACRPFRDRFITPMAAVAGAVADEVLAAMTAEAELERAYVNDGGDIALHLAPGRSFAVGVVADLARPAVDGRLAVGHADPIRGIATSGRRGRSLSFGIADAVTVLAADAAAADAAATMVANAVDAGHPAIRRMAASDLRDDTDLGDRPVTVEVGHLPASVVREALDAGCRLAEYLYRRHLLFGAVLALQGEFRVVGAPAAAVSADREKPAWV